MTTPHFQFQRSARQILLAVATLAPLVLGGCDDDDDAGYVSAGINASLDRSSIDTSGADAPGTLTSLADAVGAASALINTLAVPATVTDSSTTTDAFTTYARATEGYRSWSARNSAVAVSTKQSISYSCLWGGTTTKSRPDELTTPYTQTNSYDNCDVGGVIFDGLLTFVCDQVADGETCRHVSDVSYGVDGRTVVTQLEPAITSLPFAVSVLGGSSYPLGASAGTQSVRVGYDVFDDAREIEAHVGFELDLIYTEQQLDLEKAASISFDGTLGISESGAARNCGQGRFAVQTVAPLIAGDDGVESGVFALSSDAGTVSLTMSGNTVTVDFGGESVTYTLDDLFEYCH